MTSGGCDVAIVGAGIFGLASARALTDRLARLRLVGLGERAIGRRIAALAADTFGFP